MNLAQQIYFNTRGSATKSSMTNAWQKKTKKPGHGIYFLFFCLMSVLETLQLFDKALIGFLLEIHFKFTLNAFMTVKHVCVCQNRD